MQQHGVRDIVWGAAPKSDALGHDEIHVWRASFECYGNSFEVTVDTLSADELGRAERFKFERDRRQFIFGRSILRKLLARYAGLAPDEVRLACGPYGKPFLLDNMDLNFNLAHSHGLVLYAFARKRSLGIDVERIRPNFPASEVVSRYFSQRERKMFLSLSEPTQLEAFFNCWTRKEAYCKALGLGMQIPLDRIDVSDSFDSLEAMSPESSGPPVHLIGLSVSPSHSAALAYTGSRCGIAFFSVAPDR